MQRNVDVEASKFFMEVRFSRELDVKFSWITPGSSRLMLGF